MSYTLIIICTVHGILARMAICNNQVNRNHTSIEYFYFGTIWCEFIKTNKIIKIKLHNSGSQTFSIIRNTAYSSYDSVFFVLIIPVFSALILLHRRLLSNYLYKFSFTKEKNIHEILFETIHEFYKFIKGMLLVYLIVGLLNSVGLSIIGVPNPFLFGYTDTILTFILYIGIIISSLSPIAVS